MMGPAKGGGRKGASGIVNAAAAQPRLLPCKGKHPLPNRHLSRAELTSAEHNTTHR